MHPQLAAVLDELKGALVRLHALGRNVPQSRWGERRDPDRWSVAECVAHLNLTSAACVPLLRGVLAEARRLGGGAPARYRRDPVGWMIWKSSGPPARVRIRTTAPFVPHHVDHPADQVAAFERWQAELVACTTEAEGLPLHRVRVRSPFDARLTYSVFSLITIVPRHQHRHLWQAEQVWLRPPTR